jgi:hypothetical protein
MGLRYRVVPNGQNCPNCGMEITPEEIDSQMSFNFNLPMELEAFGKGVLIILAYFVWCGIVLVAAVR